MKHLSRDELLEAVESAAIGTRGPSAAPPGEAVTHRPGRIAVEPAAPWRVHLERCAACRDEVEMLSRACHAAALVDVPEPSPLFWDHFSRRVARAIRDDERGRTGRAADLGPGGVLASGAPWWRTFRGWRIVGPTVVAVSALVLVATLHRVPTPAPHAPLPERSSTSPAGQAGPSSPYESTVTTEGRDSPDDESWRVFSALAAEMDSEAEVAEPSPGDADEAVWHLSAPERSELVRILRSELGRGPRVEG